MPRIADPHAKIDLLRAAEAVFVEHGLDVARVEDITARAGRSKGSFYLHFASKEEVFRQIVETMLARLADSIEAAPPILSRHPDGAAVRAFFTHWLDKDIAVFQFIWHNRRVVRLLLEGGKSKSFGYLIDEFAERARVRIEHVLGNAVAASVLRSDLDLSLASLIISGAYDRVARHLVRLDEPPDLHRWLSEVQAVLLRGLATPSALVIIDGDRDRDRDPPVNHDVHPSFHRKRSR